VGHTNKQSFFYNDCNSYFAKRKNKFTSGIHRILQFLLNLKTIKSYNVSEEDTYGMLVNLANSKKIKYLFETELQYNVAWRVALQLAFKYTVRYKISSISFFVRYET